MRGRGVRFGVNEERAMGIAMEIAIVTSDPHCVSGRNWRDFGHCNDDDD